MVVEKCLTSLSLIPFIRMQRHSIKHKNLFLFHISSFEKKLSIKGTNSENPSFENFLSPSTESFGCYNKLKCSRDYILEGTSFYFYFLMKASLVYNYLSRYRREGSSSLSFPI